MRPERTVCRRGTVALELLLALPILLALLLAMIEFSSLLVARQQVLTASREGARVAALGGDAKEAEQAARRFFGEVGQAAQVEVLATDEAGQPLPAGEPVAVLVSLPTRAAVPDLLRWIGLGLGDDQLLARTVLRKE